MTFLAILVTLIGAFASPAPAQPPPVRPFTMTRTDVFMVREAAGASGSYRIAVSLPAAYEGNDRSFPVVYVLDGDWYFALAASTVRLLEVVGEMPPVIIAAIGYGGSVNDQRARRGREFTPDPVEGLAGSGEAARFLQDLQEDLIPAIESRYRTNGDRTLVGHSLGGLFATFALARAPDLVQRVVIGSPALRTSAPSLIKLLSTSTRRPQRLFLGLAEQDFPPIRDSYQSLRAWLETTPGVPQWTAEEFDNTTHQSVIGVLFARALPWVFAGK